METSLPTPICQGLCQSMLIYWRVYPNHCWLNPQCSIYHYAIVFIMVIYHILPIVYYVVCIVEKSIFINLPYMGHICFGWGTPKSPWVSILKCSNDLDDLGCPLFDTSIYFSINHHYPLITIIIHYSSLMAVHGH